MPRKKGGLEEMDVAGRYGIYLVKLWGNEGQTQNQLGKNISNTKKPYRVTQELRSLKDNNLVLIKDKPDKGPRKKSANYIYLTDRGKEIYSFFFGEQVVLTPIPDERKVFVDELIKDLKNEEVTNKRKGMAFNQIYHQFADLTFYTDWESYPEFEEFILDLVMNMEKKPWAQLLEVIQLILYIYERGYKNNKLIKALIEKLQTMDINNITNSVSIYLINLAFVEFEKYPNDCEESKEIFYVIIEKNVDNARILSHIDSFEKQHPKVPAKLKGTLRKKLYEISEKYDDKYIQYFDNILFYLSRKVH